jgi:hypothetical protein
MRNIDDIISEATGAIGALLDEAFEAGKAAGKVEAAAELRRKMAAVIDSVGQAIPGDIGAATPVSRPIVNDVTASPSLEYSTANAQPASEGRATPGTVKPTIIRIIAESPDGLSQDDIIQMTGFKPNSVRGTLHTLHTEKAIARHMGRWFTSSASGENAASNPPAEAENPIE